MKRPALLLILAVAATAAATEDEEVIVACSLATSFYERAPSDIVDAMYIAVGNACADSDHQPAWLCDGRSLTFYRGVYANNEKARSGFVCSAEAMSEPRYAPTDIHAEAFVVANEDESGSYEVSVMEEEEGSVREVEQ